MGQIEQLLAVATPSMTMDSGTLISESSLPAPESYFRQATKLAAVNPAWQNHKLISQALSAMPPALKVF